MMRVKIIGKHGGTEKLIPWDTTEWLPSNHSMNASQYRLHPRPQPADQERAVDPYIPTSINQFQAVGNLALRQPKGGGGTSWYVFYACGSCMWAVAVQLAKDGPEGDQVKWDRLTGSDAPPDKTLLDLEGHITMVARKALDDKKAQERE